MSGSVLRAALLLAVLAAPAHALDQATAGTGLARARAELGLSGEGVLVAIVDRGLDYAHPGFLDERGSTRLEAIFDLTDDTGAKEKAHELGFGTIHEKTEINRALAVRKPLQVMDEEGRGTANVGIACGNGAGSPGGAYVGVAPKATLLFVKIKLDRGKEVEPEGGEVEFFELRRLRVAMRFCVERAKALKLPLVLLMNFGQVGGPTDGKSKLCRTIDETFGPRKPGLVFVTPSGDNGDRKNRAGGRVPPGGTITLPIVKESEGEVIVDVWYPAEDRFAVKIRTPRGLHGPFEPPKTGKSEYHKEFQYYQLSSTRNLNLAMDAKRQIRVDLVGPPGKYQVQLLGRTVKHGTFDAFLGPTPENPMEEPFDHFEAQHLPGSLWDGASAANAICCGCYVNRVKWQNFRGRDLEVLGEGKVGALWLGSSTGPTADGRDGITLCAPGDRMITTYAPTAEWARRRNNIVSDGEGALYGITSGTSSASAFLTGVIALMLERNPTLDAAQVKKILQETARRDDNTGFVPNRAWGNGKLDAYAAINAVPPPKK